MTLVPSYWISECVREPWLEQGGGALSYLPVILSSLYFRCGIWGFSSGPPNPQSSTKQSNGTSCLWDSWDCSGTGRGRAVLPSGPTKLQGIGGFPFRSFARVRFSTSWVAWLFQATASSQPTTALWVKLWHCWSRGHKVPLQPSLPSLQREMVDRSAITFFKCMSEAVTLSC